MAWNVLFYLNAHLWDVQSDPIDVVDEGVAQIRDAVVASARATTDMGFACRAVFNRREPDTVWLRPLPPPGTTKPVPTPRPVRRNFTGQSAATDLNRFIVQCLQGSQPGDRHALLIFGHGLGPAGLFDPNPEFLDSTPFPMPTTRQKRSDLVAMITLREIVRALGPFNVPGLGLDLLLLHGCWMANLELSWQLAELLPPSGGSQTQPGATLVDGVVASQSMLPGTVPWPLLPWDHEGRRFPGVLETLRAAPDTVGRLRGVVDQLSVFHSGSRFPEEIPVTQATRHVHRHRPFSGLALRGMASVRPAFGRLAAELMSVSKSRRYEWMAGAYAHSERDREEDGEYEFANTGLVDVLTLCDLILAAPDSSPELRAAARDLGGAVRENLLVAHANATTVPSYRGLTIFYHPGRAPEIFDGRAPLTGSDRSVIPEGRPNVVELVVVEVHRDLAMCRDTEWLRWTLEQLD